MRHRKDTTEHLFAFDKILSVKTSVGPAQHFCVSEKKIFLVHSFPGEGVSFQSGAGICWRRTEGGNGLCLSPSFSSTSFHLCDCYMKTSSIPQIHLGVWDRSLFASHRNPVYDSLPKGLGFIGGIYLSFFFPHIKECQGYIYFHSVQFFAIHRGRGVCLYLSLTGHCSFL